MTAMLLFSLAFAPDVESGPKAGEKVPALKVSVVAGEYEGKEIDFPAERKEATTVYLIVNAPKFDRPMARFMRELDMKLPDADDKAAAAAVWVGGDLDANKDRLPKIQQSIKLNKTSYAVSADASPPGWAINSDAHLTVVVTSGGKVVKSFPFVTINETDAKGVVEEVKKAKK